MSEWNEWRRNHPQTEVTLEEVSLKGTRLWDADLRRAFLNGADLTGANLSGAHLEDALLNHASLSGTTLIETHLERTQALYVRLDGAALMKSHLEGADCSKAIVDGQTLLWDCTFDRHTKFEGVALGSMRIYPKERSLLEYNIRRMNWEEWYTEGLLLTCILKRCFVQLFWWTSDYGRSTWRTIVTFSGLALIFATVYWHWPSLVVFNGKEGAFESWWHALYLSVVTMTTLGFGDIAANPESWPGLTLLMIHVVLGYFLLGAIVTRLGVLFTAGGPVGSFPGHRTIKDAPSGGRGK